MIVTTWILTISAMVAANGGVIGASSLPDSWPVEADCQIEAEKAKAYIEKTRPDLKDIEVRCVPHRKLVEEEPAK